MHCLREEEVHGGRRVSRTKTTERNHQERRRDEEGIERRCGGLRNPVGPACIMDRQAKQIEVSFLVASNRRRREPKKERGRRGGRSYFIGIVRNYTARRRDSRLLVRGIRLGRVNCEALDFFVSGHRRPTCTDSGQQDCVTYVGKRWVDKY